MVFGPLLAPFWLTFLTICRCVFRLCFLLIIGRFCVPKSELFNDCWHRFLNVFVCAGPSKRKGGFSRNYLKTNFCSYFVELRASQFEMRATHFSINNLQDFRYVFRSSCSLIVQYIFNGFGPIFSSWFDDFSMIFSMRFSTTFRHRFLRDLGSMFAHFCSKIS